MNRKNLLIMVSFAVGLGAMAFSGTEISAETASESNKMGDVNGDNFIDSVDASMILAEYSKNSTDGNGTFNDVQKKSADINKDNFVDSVDASLVLSYYSFVSTGGQSTGIESWYETTIHNPVDTTTTTTAVTQTTATDDSTTTTTTTVTSAEEGRISEIKLTKYEMSLQVGGKDISYVTMLPENVANKDEIWTTSDEKVATVDAWGNVTAIGLGECVVTVTSVDNPSVKAEIKVKVSDPNRISEIKLTKYEMSLQVGEKDISYVTMLPENVANKDEIWTTSDEKVAIVDIWGNVTAVGMGECIVTVTSVDNPSVKAEIKVKVTDPNRISEIKLSKYEMSLQVGEKDISYVTMLPENVANKDEIWTTSDEKVATVDIWGNVTAVGLGECVVTVKSVDNPNVKAEIKVKVTDPNRISEIKLSKYEMNFKTGEKDISYVTMLPENVANKDEIWTTSDEKVATVDAWGNVTAVGLGECIVTVTSVDNPSVKAEIKVKVSDPNRISEIKLTKYEMNFKTGEKDIAYVTMLPETVANKDEVWTTSNEKVATVDIWGNVTAVGLGECIVTVTSVDNPSVKAEIKVKVTDPNRISEIKLNKYEMNFKTGEKDISYVTMLPENVANKDEIWTTSDEKVATVDAWGNVTAVGLGECVVTVTSVDNPNVKAEIKVKVTDPNRISEIKLSKYEMDLKVMGKDISYVTMLPEAVANKDEIWTTSDEKVATVDIWGNVTAVGLGECIVTVTSVDNPNVKAEIKVKVSGEGDIQQIHNITYIDGILVVNKSYALPSDYDPKMNEETMQQFNLLAESARAEGLSIYLSSGYRSYSYQETIYNNYVLWNGQEIADTFSARAGHSEHQTGLAIDVNTIDDSFAGTPEAKWLAEHAHEYGFIVRYPEGKEDITGFKYEPWHIRYLGVEKATEVYNSGLTLEEFLGIDSYYN